MVNRRREPTGNTEIPGWCWEFETMNLLLPQSTWLRLWWVWGLPTYTIYFPVLHWANHQHLPSGSPRFRICSLWYHLCLSQLSMVVPEIVQTKPKTQEQSWLYFSASTSPKSTFSGSCIPCQPHIAGQKTSLCSVTPPRPGESLVHTIYSGFSTFQVAGC
jgi:hypothetical protein